MNIIQQSFALLSPYFSPQRGNWLRLGSLAGSLMMDVIQVQYDKSMRSHIVNASEFFREKRPIEKFNTTFQSAILQGLVATVVTNLASDFFSEYTQQSLKNAMMGQKVKEWLSEENYLGFKTIDRKASEPISEILGGKISLFTYTSLVLLIDRTKELALTLLSLYRIYHLAKPLVSKSVQFPFNREGGLFAVITAVALLYFLAKTKAQERISESYAALDEGRQEVWGRVNSLERNALQVATLPPKYKESILTDIDLKIHHRLTSGSSYAMNRLLNTNVSEMFPQVFELFILYLAYGFAKADPDHFDYAKSFLPLLRESLSFMKASEH